MLDDVLKWVKPVKQVKQDPGNPQGDRPITQIGPVIFDGETQGKQGETAPGETIPSVSLVSPPEAGDRQEVKQPKPGNDEGPSDLFHSFHLFHQENQESESNPQGNPKPAGMESEIDRLVANYRALYRRLDTPEMRRPLGEAARELLRLGERIRRIAPSFDLQALQRAEGVSLSPTPLPPSSELPASACRVCGGLERWKAKGDRQPWKCARCHHPAKPEAAEWERVETDSTLLEWDEDTAWLIEWLAIAPTPSEPFTLSSGQRVSNPALWLERLRKDTTEGPKGPRARTGALQDDVRAFYRLMNTEAAGARPGAEE